MSMIRATSKILRVSSGKLPKYDQTQGAQNARLLSHFTLVPVPYEKTG